MPHYLLAIDQGTTNSRAIIFNQAAEPISQHEMPLKQSFPANGWVEQDPEEIVANSIECCREVLKKANLTARDIAAVGITNQRETTIIWNKKTGQSIYPAIVWLDRRTTDICKRYADHEHLFTKTGLRLDPYFSATKIVWMLENVQGAREAATRGDLLFGTIDTYLLWRLTGGKVHATDATNASRTLLFDIHAQQWDNTLLETFNIPTSLLPSVLDNAAHFGDMDADILGASIPIAGMAGDQQAATIGQACFKPGMIKATYGTGCFVLLNTGAECIQSQHQLLSTVAYRIQNKVTYGLEGSIFSAGTTIKWLRDKLNLIQTSTETESLAQSVSNTDQVYLVPAFSGLGAPYWDPLARGAIVGLTQNSSKAHIVRAALESVAYQTRDLLEAMTNDYHTAIQALRVDGGMTANKWLLQFLSDILNINVQCPPYIETTALGAAYLAGLQIGMYPSLDEIASKWHMRCDFSPHFSSAERETLYAGWKRAVKRVVG